MSACPWYRAWWHRRLRRIDRAQLWVPMRQAAALRHPDDEEAAALLALTGWAEFLAQPGQAHWRCPCAARDQANGNRKA